MMMLCEWCGTWRNASVRWRAHSSVGDGRRAAAIAPTCRLAARKCAPGAPPTSRLHHAQRSRRNTPALPKFCPRRRAPQRLAPRALHNSRRRRALTDHQEPLALLPLPAASTHPILCASLADSFSFIILYAMSVMSVLFALF